MSLIGSQYNTPFANVKGEDDAYFQNLTIDNLYLDDTLNVKVNGVYEPVSTTELSYLQGANANIQDQIDDILTITGTGVGFYGSFWSDADQSLTSANDIKAVSFTSYDPSGVNTQLVSGQNIQVLQAGVFNVQFSLQLNSTTGSTTETTIWIRKNGVDVPETAGSVRMQSNASKLLPAWNYILRLQQNDYITLMWSADNTAVSLEHFPASTTTPVHPAIPSAILTIQMVNYYQDNTAEVSILQQKTTAQTYTALTGTTFFSGNVSADGLYGTNIYRNGTEIDSIYAKISDVYTKTQVYTKTESDANYYNKSATYTKTETDTAIGVSAAATIATSAAAITAAVATEAATRSAADVALSGRCTALEAKTANQAAVAGVSTTFTGAVLADSVNATDADFNTLDVVDINMTGTMAGIGKLNLSSTTGAHLVQAPSITLNSVGGAGAVYLGNFTDIVYVNNFPIASLLWTQW